MASGALYPGTFDPFTNGHEQIVRRAAGVFGRVVIAVAASPTKAPLFDLDQRIALVKAAVGDVAAIQVVGFSSLTVKCAREHELAVIVRGLRVARDFEYEFQLATMNRHLEDSIETVYMSPTEQYMFVSSTLVRELAALGGDVEKLVHPDVAAALSKRFPQS